MGLLDNHILSNHRAIPIFVFQNGSAGDKCGHIPAVDVFEALTPILQKGDAAAFIRIADLR